MYEADGKSRPVKMKAVTDLLERLTARHLATSFPPPGTPEDKMGYAKPAAEVKLWENGIVREEKPDPNAKPKVTAPPTARILFGHKDVGDVVYARRLSGDTKSDFFVPARRLPARLAAASNTSTRRSSRSARTRCSSSHSPPARTSSSWAGRRQKPAAQATWKINSPERLKGRSADAFKCSDLLNQLSFMQPTKVASDKVTDEVLNRLEVNPASPRMKVTATIKDQGERVFLFGGDAGTKKDTVYLRPMDQELVFEVDRRVFDQFQKADVQDTVVHRIDKAQVKAVKITGWQEVLGSPTTLEIERKDGKWTLKSGGMFELDPAKVDAFLNDLTTPKADAFVVIKEGAKPEHNLEVAKNALAVEIVLETGEPVKMAISPPNKDGKVFAPPGPARRRVHSARPIRRSESEPAAFKKGEAGGPHASVRIPGSTDQPLTPAFTPKLIIKP